MNSTGDVGIRTHGILQSDVVPSRLYACTHCGPNIDAVRPRGWRIQCRRLSGISQGHEERVVGQAESVTCLERLRFTMEKLAIDTENRGSLSKAVLHEAY